MSNFIVPMGSLPSISSLTDLKPPANLKNAVGSNIPFADFLETAIKNVGGTDATSQSTMMDLALGATDDLHTGSIAAVKASTAINYATGLVTKAISAYKEIIQIQV